MGVTFKVCGSTSRLSRSRSSGSWAMTFRRGSVPRQVWIFSETTAIWPGTPAVKACSDIVLGTAQSTFHFTPGKPVPSNVMSTSLGSTQQAYSHTAITAGTRYVHIPTTVARYSFIQMSELTQSGVNEIAQASKRQQVVVKLGSLNWESDVLTTMPPCPTGGRHQWDYGGRHQWDSGGRHQWDNGGRHQWDNGGRHQWDNGGRHQWDSRGRQQWDRGGRHQWDNGQGTNGIVEEGTSGTVGEGMNGAVKKYLWGGIDCVRYTYILNSAISYLNTI